MPCTGLLFRWRFIATGEGYVSFLRKMNMRQIFIIVIVTFISLLGLLSLEAFELDKYQPYGNCKEFSEKELNSIRSSNKPALIMGAGIVSLANNSTSRVGMELLELSSRTESSKVVAAISLINYYLDPSRALPLNPLKEDIVRLLKDDNNNALSYYLNALLLQEEGECQKALDQIKKGNVHKFDCYPKQRFYAIVQAAEMAEWSGRLSRELAFWNSHSAPIYIKLRHLCRNMEKEYGQEAKDVCMVLGKNLETASLTCVENLLSLAIKTESLNDSPSDDVARSEIKKRRDIAFSCGGCTSDVQEFDVTDKVDKKYYEILLDKGEVSAQKYIGDFVNQKQQGN